MGHCANTVASVLTECWNHDGTPNKHNYRHECAKLMQAHAEQEPWFGLEQEYTLLDLNDRPYGWPQNVRAPPYPPTGFPYVAKGSC
jgi:glutamine synthetase